MFDRQGHLKIGPEDDVKGLQVKLLVGLSTPPPPEPKAEACVLAFRSEAAERPSFLWRLVNLHRTHIEKSKGEKKKEKKHPDATLVRHHLRLRGAPYIDRSCQTVNCQSPWRSLGEEKDNRDEKQGPVLVGCCRAIWPADRLALVWLWPEHGGNSVNELVRDGVSKWRSA